MDNLLSGLFGGRDDDTPETRMKRAGDFVHRVESGAPTEGYSAAEALQNYRHAASKLPDDEYIVAARDALARFTPQQRQEFGQLLNEKTGASIRGDIDSPAEIAQLTNHLRSDQGSPLGALLGGGGGLDDIIGALTRGGGSGDLMGALGGLLGGTSSSPARQAQTSGIADLIKNPIVQSVLAAIAATAIKKFGGGDLSGSFSGDASTQRAGATSPQNPRIAEPTVGADTEDRGGGLLDAIFGGGDKGDDHEDFDDLKRQKRSRNI